MRVPCVVRWPGRIPAGRASNEIQAHEDLYLTLATAAGLDGIKDKLLTGQKIGDTTYKVHLDGYDNTALWTGASEKSARREFFYYDETDLMGLRVDNWKLLFGVKMGGTWWDPKSYPQRSFHLQSTNGPYGKNGPAFP